MMQNVPRSPKSAKIHEAYKVYKKLAQCKLRLKAKVLNPGEMKSLDKEVKAYMSQMLELSKDPSVSEFFSKSLQQMREKKC